MSDRTEINPDAGGPPSQQVPGWQPPPSLVGTVLADRYKVISTLGDGGMGSVYLGEHVTLRKKVAIKVLKQEFCHDKTNVERFLQEARAASMIRHENIVDIMDFGQVPGGSVFFVMELLEGIDLSDLIKEKKRLPWLRTRNILLQVVRSLRAAHESGIIHRDMKPANVFLINRSAAKDYVKVLDFGIAKVDDQNTGLTRTGAVFGTAGYMAPEQACGDPVDGRTDIYAVGCMMFEMLTGRTPFPGNNFMRVLTQHMNEPPPPPRDVCPDADVSDEVETIIMTALAKKAEDRYPDMAAFEKAIAIANGEIQTLPPKNRPRTDGGTLVLGDEGEGIMSPFAGMTPGQPPPAFLDGGGEHPVDATMMLDGMGGASFGDDADDGGGGADHTMMLDGMGGISLGNEGDGGGQPTMMLDDLGNAATMTGGDVEEGESPAAASVVATPDEEQGSKKKLYMMIGGAVGVLGLVGVLAMAFGGGDGDETEADTVAVNEAKTEAGEEPKDKDSGGEDANADSGEPPPVEPTPEPVDNTPPVEPTPPPVEPTPEPVEPTPEPVEEPTPVDKVPKPQQKTTQVKDALSSSDISKGLGKIQGKVSACKSAGGLPGMKVQVNFMIKDGKVPTASARGAHATTPVGKCVAGAVKKARFAKAKQSKIVDHTFKL